MISDCIAQSVARLTEEQEVPGTIPSLSGSFVEIAHKIFSMSFSPFHWFKKASCQLLAKVYTLSTG